MFDLFDLRRQHQRLPVHQLVLWVQEFTGDGRVSILWRWESGHLPGRVVMQGGHDVARFEIAMDDAFPMRVLYGAAHGDKQLQTFVTGSLLWLQNFVRATPLTNSMTKSGRPSRLGFDDRLRSER